MTTGNLFINDFHKKDFEYSQDSSPGAGVTNAKKLLPKSF